MSKKRNKTKSTSSSSSDLFEYEKQWQIFKGNEYMSNLLTKMKPKISCDCPQSYLDFQKMPKNNMGNYAKEHERLFQNAIHHKKLRSILNRQISNAYILPEIFRLENLLKHKSKYKENILANQLYKDNQHMLKRIIQSKSFFSKARAYYGFPSNNHNHSVSYSNNNSHNQTKNSFRKEMNKSSSCLFNNNSAIHLMNKTNDNDIHDDTFYNKTNRTNYFRNNNISNNNKYNLSNIDANDYQHNVANSDTNKNRQTHLNSLYNSKEKLRNPNTTDNIQSLNININKSKSFDSATCKNFKNLNSESLENSAVNNNTSHNNLSKNINTTNTTNHINNSNIMNSNNKRDEKVT